MDGELSRILKRLNERRREALELPEKAMRDAAREGFNAGVWLRWPRIAAALAEQQDKDEQERRG
jgi:hypothetical protein